MLTYAHIQELPPKDWGRVIQEWVAAEHQAGVTARLGGCRDSVGRIAKRCSPFDSAKTKVTHL